MPGVVAPPPPGVWLPLIVIVAVADEPSVAPPVGFERFSAKDLDPLNGVELESATVTVFAAASPLAQLKMPLAAVNSLPAAAVPAAVAYATLTAPSLPCVRTTVSVTEPADCATVSLADCSAITPGVGEGPFALPLGGGVLPLPPPPPEHAAMRRLDTISTNLGRAIRSMCSQSVDKCGAR